MNIETLDFQELLTEQQNSPQQTEYNENNLISESAEVQKEEGTNKKTYPLGTVVMLHGGKKRLMIVGFYPLNEEKTGKAYDYIGCLFPEGLLATDKFAMFNHDQIEKVYHEGLNDEEEKEFKERLESVFEDL